MEKDFKKLYFELKEQFELLKTKLQKKDNELNELQKKYMELLVKKESNNVSRFSIIKTIDKKEKKEAKKIPIRLMVLTVIMTLLVSLFVSAVNNDSSGFYAEITKGLVFPKRAIASISDIFYHK